MSLRIVFLLLNGAMFFLLAAVVSLAALFAVSWAHRSLVTEYLGNNASLLKGVTDSKRSTLRRFCKTHTVENDLTQTLERAILTNKFAPLVGKLERLKKNAEVDKVDIILDGAQSPLLWKNLSQRKTYLRKIRAASFSVNAIEVDKIIYLIANSPIGINGQRKGQLLVAIALNDGLEERMAEVTNAKFKYFLSEQAQKDEGLAETQLIRTLGYKNIAGHPLTVKVTLYSEFLDEFINKLTVILLIICAAVFFFIWLPGQFYLRRKIITPFLSLYRAVSHAKANLEKGTIQDIPRVKGTLEIEQFSQVISELFLAFRQFSTKEVERIVAKQVVHDIKSQISTLQRVLENHLADGTPLTDHQKYLTQNTLHKMTTTLRDVKVIADSELRKFPSSDAILSTHSIHCRHSASVQLIPSLLKDIVDEKRYEVGLSRNIHISYERSQCGFVFCLIDPVPFTRAISNLMNNGIEALPKGGKLEVRVTGNQSFAFIDIVDNGQGMDADTLAQLGQREFSHNKPLGQGLGFTYAKEVIESYHGQMTVNSRPGRGTEIHIWIPAQVPPVWALQKLTLPKHGKTVIVDDDPEIHRRWNQRLEKHYGNKLKTHVKHFLVLKEFTDWMASHSPKSTNGNLFLCDYQLTGQVFNGLEIIAKQRIENQAILVTNYYDEKQLQIQCVKLGIKLMPKDFIENIPIEEMSKDSGVVPPNYPG